MNKIIMVLTEVNNSLGGLTKALLLLRSLERLGLIVG